MACQMSLHFMETEHNIRRRRERFFCSNLSSFLPMESQLHGNIPYISIRRSHASLAQNSSKKPGVLTYLVLHDLYAFNCSMLKIEKFNKLLVRDYHKGQEE